MKRTLLIAATTLLSTATFAQYINEAPAGGFDVSTGKDYVVLYAPESVVTQMGEKLISNQNLDPEMERNQFYYWTCDWAPTDLQVCNVEEPDGKNSFGGSDYLNITPLFDWGGGGFAAKSQAYDLSKVDDDHIIHIGLRDFGTAESKFKFQFGPLGKIKTNGFSIEVNLPEGEADGDYAGVGSIGHDGKWYSLDIPVKDLIDESGDFGFTYDFSQPFDDHVFTVTFGDATPSTATGVLEPGNEVKTYTITKLGSALSLDAIFFYKDDSSAGISDITLKGGSDKVEAVYDLSGRRTEMNRPGIYVVKTPAGTKKVAVK